MMARRRLPPGERSPTSPSSSTRSTTCIGAVSKTSPTLAQASRNPDRTSVAPSPPRAPVRALSLAATLLHLSHFEVGGEGLGLVYGDVGLEGDRHQVVDDVAPDQTVRSPVIREADSVDLLAFEIVDWDAVGDQGLAMDLAAARRDGHPARVIHALLGGQLGADLAEQLGLQLGEPGDPTAHRPAGVMLGQAVSGHYVGIPGILGRVVGIVRPVQEPYRRIILDVVVEQVRDRRLDGLVVDRERTVGEAHGGEEPAEPVAVDDERPVSRDGVVAFGIGAWPVIRPLGRREIGDVVADPLALLLVPPDVLFLLGPRLTLGVGRGPVVEDATIRGPGPAPLVRRRWLLRPGLAPPGLVDAACVGSGVDPTTTRRRAVVLEIGEARDRLPIGHGKAAYLLEDALYVRLLALALGRVVPGDGF